MSCRCDPECGHYDDCCPDAGHIYGLHPASKTWKCLPVTTDLEGYAFSTKVSLATPIEHLSHILTDIGGYILNKNKRERLGAQSEKNKRKSNS